MTLSTVCPANMLKISKTSPSCVRTTRLHGKGKSLNYATTNPCSDYTKAYHSANAKDRRGFFRTRSRFSKTHSACLHTTLSALEKRSDIRCGMKSDIITASTTTKSTSSNSKIHQPHTHRLQKWRWTGLQLRWRYKRRTDMWIKLVYWSERTISRFGT